MQTCRRATELVGSEWVNISRWETHCLNDSEMFSEAVGALLAMVGVSEESTSQATATLAYLEAVARKGRLDFVPHPNQRFGDALL